MAGPGDKNNSPAVATEGGAAQGTRDATAAQAPPETGTAAASERLLQASTGAGNRAQPPLSDNLQPEPQAGPEDTRNRFVTEFVGTAGGARVDRQTPQRDVGDRRSDAPATSQLKPETFVQGLDELERNFKKNGMPTASLNGVREQFQRLRDAGKLPQDLRAINDIVRRLNENATNGKFVDSGETMLRMVEANLKGKVVFVTPDNVKDSINRDQFNRENPEYAQGATNCRACTASYIINEALSERALMAEFDKIIGNVETGNISGKKINVPLENGLPRMTAYLFQMNHGDAHTGIAGQKYTQKEVRAFEAMSESVPDYIQRGLREAGFADMLLPGGEKMPSRWPPKEPGFYVLEHRSNDTSGSVNGHVTVAFVDRDKRIHKLDTQHPDNRSVDWPVTHSYKVVFSTEAKQVTSQIEGGTRVRVLNPDSTMRDVWNGTDKRMTGLTDVDGQKYVKDSEGKWKVQNGTDLSDARFNNVENLGTKDGFKFTFDKFTVTEQPNGTAQISFANRSVIRDGKPLVVNGVEVKVGDIISQISRSPDGNLNLLFKDNTTTVLKPNASLTQPAGIRSLEQLGRTLDSFDATSGDTTNGGTLDRAISDRLAVETAKGTSLETAVMKLVKPGVDEAGAERLSRIGASLSQAGLPTDASRIAQVDKVMLELRLSEQDVKKANTIVERAGEHIALREINNKPLTERQALELAILENTPDPSKADGKPLPLRSAVKKLREIEEMRTLMREPEASIRDCLATQSLLARDADVMKDTTHKARASKTSAAETNRAYALVTNPETLKAAEDMYRKIGGKEAGFSLWDASVIAQNPVLRENPALGAEIYERISQLRGSLAFDKGYGTANGYHASDYLEMGRMLHAEGKLPIYKSGDLLRVEADYQKRRAEETAQRRGIQSQASAEVPAQSARSNSTGAEVTPPLEASRVMTFKSRLSGLNELPREQMLGEFVRSAQRAVSSDVSRQNRMTFVTSPVNVAETPDLKPGESQLIVSNRGNAIKVKAVEGGDQPVVITEDGSRVALKDCLIEVRIGQGSTSEQAACEALVRTTELKDMMDGKLSEPARRHIEHNSIRALYHRTEGPTIEGSGQHVAERVVSLGAFEFQNNRVDVSLSERGVKFGAKGEVPYEILVRDTLRDKRSHRDQLQADQVKTKDLERAGQIKILNEQIADLEHLQRNLHRPETGAKLMDAITKHATPQEIERLKAEIAAGKGSTVKGTVVRAGTYSLVAAFVAGVLASGGSSEASESPRYAPTSAN